jgi:putative ABC transport system ATP-binding protein
MFTMTEPVIQLHSLRQQLAPGVYFRLEELCVEAGDAVALTGPSGCGKSTLLNFIAGLSRAETGSVRVLGRELGSLSTTALDRHRGRHIGMVFQSFHLLSAFTALENVGIGQRFSGRPGDAAAMLQRVGLGHRLRTRVRHLSVGEKQRVAIARALIGQPDLLLADEPTGSLDPQTGRQVFELMRDITRESGTTLLMVTHETSLATELPRQFDCAGLICGDPVGDPADKVKGVPA